MDEAVTKEHFSVISRFQAEGPSVKLLGLTFDTSLKMDEEVVSLASRTSWKLRNLLRTRRYFDTRMIIHLFKSRILEFVEYRTAGVYHANAIALAQLDGVYTKFLKAAGLSFEEALLEFGLAPLNARRDIAMLCVIHRTVLGLGPEHFRKFFVPAERSTNPSGRANLRRHNIECARIVGGLSSKLCPTPCWGRLTFTICFLNTLLPLRTLRVSKTDCNKC